MPHRYKVREIAQQAGLSEATVDRVLNDRPGVRENTRAEVTAGHRRPGQTARPAAAQRQALPDRRGHADAAAVLRRVPRGGRGRAARLSPRRCCGHGSTSGRADRRAATIGRRAGRLRGSHGVILKAPDEPEVAEAVDRLVDAGIPVVTYATDVPTSARCGYVGIDNHGAGVTAAYLMDSGSATAPSDVLITLSRNGLPRRRGARSRVPLRVARLGHRRSSTSPTATASTPPTSGWSSTRCDRHPNVDGGLFGGRRQHRHRRGFEKLGRDCRVFIAHDLDADNRRLLREGRHLGGAAQRSARRRPAGAADDPAGARGPARRAGATGAGPGGHARTTFQPDSVTLSACSAGCRRSYPRVDSGS